MPIPTCAECKHYIEGERQFGWCVIHAPVVQFLIVPKPDGEGNLVPAIQDFSGWPKVKPSHRCGEFTQGLILAH